LTPNELVFRFGVLAYVPILVKIDQEMRPWECSQTDTQIHWQT